MTAFRAVLLLSLFCVAAAEKGPGEVVSRVVSLIEELKAKIQQDGKVEQKMYDKYACWCETTSARKANDIHQAMTDIKVLSSKILETKGLVQTRVNEIKELTGDIMENQKEMDEATAIRQKENGAYMANKAEMEQTLGALERAIKTLSGAGTKTGLLQLNRPSDEFALLHTAAAVHEAAK